MPTRVVATIAEVDAIESEITAAASATLTRLATELAGLSSLHLLAKLKFELFGRHPLEPRNLNLIEQLNQTFTYLATTAAARWLLEKHPQSAPLTLRLGATPGIDITSADGAVEAETFAAVDPSNNAKLKNDVAKLNGRAAPHRYVFYICPSHPAEEYEADGVTVVSLGWKDAV